jgi:integrase
MKVQKVNLGSKITYIVIGEDFLPISTINKYLKYIEDVGFSVHTIRTYATALSIYWDFLRIKEIDWRNITLEVIAEYIQYLRNPLYGFGLISSFESIRTESTINLYLAALGSFLDFYCKEGILKENVLYGSNSQKSSEFKSFLHHINQSKPNRSKKIVLKNSKLFPKTLSKQQVSKILDSCNNLRDLFLFTLLYESGMRIGQALGLRHSDIKSMDNEIFIIPRTNNENLSRQKTLEPYVIHVSQELMGLYTDYIINDLDELETDYVFVNLWGGHRGKPLTYETVSKIVERLVKKTNISFNVHMFRHTHATQLIKEGWNMAYVQNRLGHKHIQTTINTYIHVNNEDMKSAFKKYQGKNQEEK